MIISKYPKGAEWRKWDLHVHTPLSVYQKFGQDNEETWEKYISDLENLPSEFAVIGVNDYLFIDGYSRLLREQQNNNRITNLKLLPVVEFRIEKFAGVEFGNFKRINLHVIFSEDVSVETIKSQFLNMLEQSYTLDTGEKWARAITPESVKELGASIKKGVSDSQLSKYGTDLVEGFNNLNVKEDQIFNSLKKDCFEGKYLIAIGKTEWADLKWSDSSIATKKSIINDADIVFTSAESVEAFDKAKKQLTDQGVNDLLLDCSDAHYFSTSTDKDRLGKCFTWLKADPTFDGLRQVINEPIERIYIGEEPPLFSRVSKNRTKYIKELAITQVEGYDDEQNVWFKDVCIPLNSELVAIIGNKGSGKSAIADVLSLCANYYDKDDFSFLTPNKFKTKNGRLAKKFKANLTWESGNEGRKNLNDSLEKSEILEVKYLPQGRFERLTNEISSASKFQTEIESVVFSHIPETEALGALTFKELISKKTVAVTTDIETLKNDVKEVNEEIIKLEQKTTNSYKAEVENRLKKKKEEIEALVEPTPVSDPNEDPLKKQRHESVNIKITELRLEIETIEVSIKKFEGDKKTSLEKIQKINDVISAVEQKEVEHINFIKTIESTLNGLDINLTDLVSLETDFTQIKNLLELEGRALEEIKFQLGESEKGSLIDSDSHQSLPEILENNASLLKTEKGKLDFEQQVYQSYLTDKDVWQKGKQTLVGTSETPNTLQFFEAELEYLKEVLNEELERKYEERREITRNIFNKKQDVISVYKSARNKLNDIISRNQNTLKDYKIEVDASLVKSLDFITTFLGYILQNKMGSFHSKDGGEKVLNSLISEVDFDNKDSVIDFLDALMQSLKFDRRVGQNNESRDIDLSPRINTMTSMRFPIKYGQWRFQNEETLQRRTNYKSHQAARSRRQS